MALGFKTKTGNCCFNLDRTSSGTVVMATAQQVLCCCFFFWDSYQPPKAIDENRWRKNISKASSKDSNGLSKVIYRNHNNLNFLKCDWLHKLLYFASIAKLAVIRHLYVVQLHEPIILKSAPLNSSINHNIDYNHYSHQLKRLILKNCRDLVSGHCFGRN